MNLLFHLYFYYPNIIIRIFYFTYHLNIIYTKNYNFPKIVVDLARLNNNLYVSENKNFAYEKIILYNRKSKIAHVSSVSPSILHAIMVAQMHHFRFVFCFVMDECMSTTDMNYKSKAAQSIYLSRLATFLGFRALSHIKMGSAFSL